MKQIWQASKDPRNWQGVQVSSVVQWWWVFYLISGFAGQIVFRLGLRAKTLDQLLNLTIATIVAAPLGIVSALLAIALIRQVQDLQSQSASGLASPSH